MNRKTLSLKREALTALVVDELSMVAGAQAALTDVCYKTQVCATVDGCLSDGCTYQCFYTMTCS